MLFLFFLMIRRPPRSTQSRSSAASDVYKRQNQETELGNLCADVVADSLGLDIMLFASGSIRKQELGPIVTLKDFKECFPFDDKIFRIKLTKRQIEKAFETILGKDMDSHTEFYQVSKGFKVKYSKKEKRVANLVLELSIIHI
mgnify:CR=1 FL=1